MTTENQNQMPAIFIGHGSPMNAIENNEFADQWRKTGEALPRPKAILCISGHWNTRGTHVTAAEKPPTIHDFGGFPEELFKIRYPAPGSPELANEVKRIVKSTEVIIDDERGLDHGCWSVLMHMFPAADIPVVQLSLDFHKEPQAHYNLGRELLPLRNEGILIVGTGNLVHNLRMVAWDSEPGYGFDWAADANTRMKEFIMNDDHESLINYRQQGKSFDLAIPSPDHYLPLLYILALKQEGEKVTLFNDKLMMGSLSMTSVILGNFRS